MCSVCRRLPAAVRVLFEGEFVRRVYPMDPAWDDALFGAVDRTPDPYVAAMCRPCMIAAFREDEEGSVNSCA